jgi:hypothetical protein
LSSAILMWSQSFSLSCLLTAKARIHTSTVCCITSNLHSTTSSTTSITMVPRSVKTKKNVRLWGDKGPTIREARLDLQPRLVENTRIHWQVKCRPQVKSSPS